MERIFSELGISGIDKISVPNTIRQSDALNEDWYERVISEAKSRAIDLEQYIL